MARSNQFKFSETLFNNPNAFAHSVQTAELFDAAMREAVIWHSTRCPEFAAFLKIKGFKISSHTTAESIPPIFITIFKEFRLSSISPSEVKIELTSSGTSGRKSAIILDKLSYQRILKIVNHIFSALGLVNRSEKVNYLCFTYDPKKAKNVGTAFSDKILTGLTLRNAVYYALKWNANIMDFSFDLLDAVNTLLKFAEEKLPVRILGFPAYLWQIIEQLEKNKTKLRLGLRSFVITGGGWKIHKDKEVAKPFFKEKVAYILGIPVENIRDTFGMVEHGIPYVDCEYGNLHVPIYAKARVVDPETLETLPEGVPGLLHVMSPYLSSYPSISLLTTDRAVIRTKCPCGRQGAYLEILGRAGVVKHKGCAITALEYLKS